MNFALKKSDLNFKVYTVASKPTAPGAENDIAIISSVPMTNWMMSPERPSGMPRNDGDVWIQYSTQGNTKNILKQNALMISTISAWQHVDGAWVDREAVSYQGGKWVDWFRYLYKAGNEYTDITGGWYKSYNHSSTTFTKYDNYMSITGVNNVATGVVSHKTAIRPLSKKLCAEVEVINNSVNDTMSFCTVADGNGRLDMTMIPTIGGKQVIYMDMTSWLEHTGYIVFSANGNATVKIHNVWFE